MGEPYRTRAAATLKDIGFRADAIELHLILDHGFRIYSEQRVWLSGVRPRLDEGTPDLIKSFVENWIAHSAKPSTLWVLTWDLSGRASIERQALDELGRNPTGELHSLAADLVEQGLVHIVEHDQESN